jgi:ELWxxDGT repeat protein
MATNPTTNSPLVPVNLTTAGSKLKSSQLTNVDGTVYFQGYDPSTTWGLYKLDASGQPLLLGNPNTYGKLGLSMITNAKGIVYFVGYDGTKQGLYRVDPGTGAPVRLGDMLIMTSNAGPSGNIVNIAGSDYFIANRGNKQLWKIDRVSGALAQVTPTGLPANFSFSIDEPNTGNNFRAPNNNLAIGGNLYFRGNGQVWKFDPITNNATPIQIPNRATYAPGELHQLGDALFFKTNSSSTGQELYRIDSSGSATLVSDPKFASSNYVIDDNNFIDVNGTLHFVANYGNEIWKLDSTGKAVLAGTVSGAGRSNEATEFTNVNGTVYFNFDDGTNKAQIWKLKSDGTTTSVTTLAPNSTYGKTFVGGLKGIGNQLYFSANDAQYGTELRELDSTTDSLTTLDLSPGLYASSPADSSLNSNLIDVNGTPYFSSSVKPEGVSYSENRIYKLAPAGTVVPTPTTPVTSPNPVDTTPATPVVEPVITVTAVDKNAAETKTGEIANGGQFVLTRKGDVSAAKDAFYLLSGTATNGVDYQKLTGKATFEAGKTTTTVDIKNIVDDNIYEDDETILLSIVPEGQATGGAFKIASNLSNTAILNKLLGDTTGLSNINLTVTGNKEAYGTFDNAPFDIGAGIVLSTGKVTDLVGANNDSGTTTSFNTSDSDGGFDPIVLKVDFNTDSTARQVFFQYVFGSEEFIDFSGSEFNDLFTLALNGVNLAKLSDGKTTSINNLTPLKDAKTWSSDYINNPSGTGPLSSQVILDGYTKTLTFAGNLIPNAKNTLEIKIKDINDDLYDSAVFLKGGSLGVVDPTTLANAITIADNDLPPVVSLADVSFNEGKNGTSTGTFTVELSNPSSLVTTVDYGTADGTALAGIDYTKVKLARRLSYH